VPLLHALQAPASRKNPARHTQEAEPESKAEVECGRAVSHRVHALSEPGAALYFPVAQAVHDRSSPFHAVSNPALHRQLLSAGEPLGDCEAAGQATQALNPSPEYVFVGQV